MKLFAKLHYERLFGLAPEKTVSELQAEISAAQNKISEIQSKCSHKETYVGMYSWRVGAMEPRKICRSCSAVTNFDLTDEEIENCWRKQYG